MVYLNLVIIIIYLEMIDKNNKREEILNQMDNVLKSNNFIYINKNKSAIEIPDKKNNLDESVNQSVNKDTVR